LTRRQRPDPVQLRRAGDLLLSNLVWVHHSESRDPDLVAGRVHIDAADLHLKQQTRAVYAAVKASLQNAGIGLEHVLHQRVHLRDMRDYGRWIEVLQRDHPGWKPATTVFGEGHGLPPGIEVAVEIVASAVGAASAVWVDAAAASTDPFPGCMRSGGWIFTSAVAPLTPEGTMVESHEQLASWEGVGPVSEFSGQGALGRRDDQLAAQMLAVYANLQLILSAAESDLKLLVKQNGYTRMHMKSFTPIEAARRSIFRKAADTPPASTVQVVDFGPTEKAALQFEAIAVSGGVEVSRPPTSATTPYGFYSPVACAGGVAFTAGELAFSSEIGGVVGSWENDPGRSLVQQARFVARRIKALFAAGKVEPAGIARLNVYLRDRAFAEAWTRLTLEELGGSDPAIVETTVLDCGPYESCLFELDGVGAVAGL
jgi:enamine deaminase RidA (YjgF/YER057c/UK114 family)